MNEIKSVIFDMDGVIVDSHPAHRKAWHQFLQSINRDVSESELEFILDGRKRSEILRHFLGEMPEKDLAEYGRMKDEFFQRISFDVKPVPGVLEFVEDLTRRRIKLGVATSASKSRTMSTLRRLHLTDAFAAVVTGDDVPEGKSSPAIYKIVCQHLRTQACDSVVVEDAASAVKAAKTAGFRCIGVGSQRSAQLEAAGADHIIDDFVGFSIAHFENGHNGNGRSQHTPTSTRTAVSRA